ncbi:MAG: DUF1189 family protein [Candidatus Omnitrophica bacterium]|nr:DUF1189 family protein [Candidatus Omnitrophota bacterium]
MKNLLEVFSFNACEKINKERFSRCVGFFFILVLAISVIFSLQFTVFTKTKFIPQVNLYITNFLAQLSDGFPETVVQNGMLASPRETFVREIKDKDFPFAFIIEPDGGKTQALLDAYQNCFLLTQQKIVIKSLQDGRVKMEEYDLKKVSFFKAVPLASGFKLILENKREFILSPETAGSLMKKVMLFVWPVSFLLSFIYFCITKTIQILFFSFVSLLINAITAAKLSYRDMLAIGIYALAPPTITLAVLQVLAGKPFLGQAFLFAGIYVLYIYKGITVNKAGVSAAAGGMN